jgi:ketosteroid isomerase-like protein
MRAGVLKQHSHFYFAAIDRPTFPGLLSVTFMSDKVSVLSDHVRSNRQAVIARILLIALVALLSANMLQAGQAKPKKHEVRHEIFDLEDAWRNAVLKSDINAMNALLADDYMAITASGMLQTKQESLANMRAHHVHFTTLLLSDRKVRFYGKTALVTSKAEVQGTTPEGDISGDFRYTRVYVRDNQGRWKIVSFESSKIRAPGEHKKQDSGPGGQ